MVQKRWMEIGVGAFVAAGLAALFMLAMKVSNLSSSMGAAGYSLEARFENVGGLKVRAPVTMAGVRIGQVSDIDIDGKTFEARVRLDIAERFNQLPLDTSASIFTAGLLGENYIALEAGGEEKVLKDGDELKLTQSALVLEQVLGQFLFSKAAGDE